jgi:hypothetical protein
VSLGDLPDKTTLTAWIHESKFMVEAFGRGDSVAEIGEQLAWLGAALRSSPYELGVAYCTPFISDIDNAPHPVSGTTSWTDILCKIDFTVEEREEHLETSNGQCWHNMFRNPVVVKGYPIPRISESNTGLEIPLNMMAGLTRTQHANTFNRKLFIKGFSTMLLPTKHSGNLLIWHLLYNKDGSRISYLDNTIDHEADIAGQGVVKLVESQEEAIAEEALPQKEETKPSATAVHEQLSPAQSVIVPPNVQSAQFQFQRIGEDCYAATTMTLDHDLQNMFDKQLRWRICSILKRLKLNDSRISLECAMISPKRNPTAMKPTILCMCLAQDQRKAIVNAFGQMSFIPKAFSYKVIISDVRKSSPGNSPPHLGSMIGRTVEVIFHKQLETLCGTPMRTLLSDDGSKYAKSTIGGLIVVNESLFALTTAHGFASTIKETSFLDKDGYPERSLTTKPLNATPTFKPLGTIHSYEWTDNYNHEEDLQDYEDAASQDWALVDIQPPLYVRNSFSFLDESINIEGYLPVDDLTFGEVHICSSNSGIQKAILSGSTASVLMDKLLFEVRSISLEHELGNLILLCSSLCSMLT